MVLRAQLLDPGPDLLRPGFNLGLIAEITFLEPGKLHEKALQGKELGKLKFSGEDTRMKGLNIGIFIQRFFYV